MPEQQDEDWTFVARNQSGRRPRTHPHTVTVDESYTLDEHQADAARDRLIALAPLARTNIDQELLNRPVVLHLEDPAD